MSGENKQEKTKNKPFINWLNRAGKAWKDFWDKPVTVQYAYNPHAVVGNGGAPFQTTQRRGDFATQTAAAVAIPATAAGVATVGVVPTLVGMGVGIGAGAAGSAGGSKLVELAGGDKNAQEMVGDIAGFTLGAIAGGKATHIPRVIKGTYETFSPQTDVLNRILHPITTVRVGNIQSKAKHILPKALYDQLLNKLKTVKYQSSGELAYSPSVNTIQGTMSLMNDDYGLAHEVGHVLTTPEMLKTIPIDGYYYNISAPRTYQYNPNTLHTSSTIQNEFYSDLFATQLGYKPSWFAPYRRIMRQRYKTTKPYIKERLFTNDPLEFKAPEAVQRSLSDPTPGFQKKLNVHKQNLQVVLKRRVKPEAEFILDQFNKFVIKYGIDENEVMQMLQDIGMLDYMDEAGISRSLITSKKQGGKINYLNLMGNGR